MKIKLILKNYTVGVGKSFNWELLQNYDNEKPIFLSGGLSLKNIPNLSNLQNINIYCLDLNSCFEKSAGLKDLEMLKQLDFTKIRANQF